MAITIYPTQTRQIDPFSNYNSDVVSRLTKMITRGNDSVHSPHSIDVIEDSTANQVVVTTGEFFKDNILISVDTDFTVDMTDSDFYVSGNAFDEAGYYWILAHYVYAKQIPAPQVSIQILKPSQHSSFDSDYFFLKAVYVEFNGSFSITSLHDADPNDLTGNGKRVYTQIYPGMENTIPSTFIQSADEGRLIYVRDKSSMYFGTQNKFEIVDSVRDLIDTTSCFGGDLAFVDTDGKVYPSQADSTATFAEVCVLERGVPSDGSGKIKTSGRVDYVPIEDGVTMYTGDDCYLSVTDSGTVTNVKPSTENEIQYVGTSLSDSEDSTWTGRTEAEDNDWYGTVWSPELNLFVAVSHAGTTQVMTSPDGINWTGQTAASANQWHSITWSPLLRLFVATSVTGTDDRVMTSPDGINWTSRVSPADNSWYGVTWSPDLEIFVAVAASGGVDRVMTSPDGINWTLRTSASNNNWRSVVWAQSLRLFVAVASSGTGDRVMTSGDGINWTTRTSAADNQWFSVTWSPIIDLFVAVANSGTGDRAMISSDGINWSTVSVPDYAWRGVIWTRRLFAAVSNTLTATFVMTSPDGVNWTTATPTASQGGWNGMAWSPELDMVVSTSFFVAGANGVMSAYVSPNVSMWLFPIPQGAKGYSGFSGYQGTSGFSGYSGVSGFSGYSGVSGFSGYSGVSGFSGYSGVSGFSGYSGVSGFSGYSGVSGFSGYSGTAGSQALFMASPPGSQVVNDGDADVILWTDTVEIGGVFDGNSFTASSSGYYHFDCQITCSGFGSPSGGYLGLGVWYDGSARLSKYKYHENGLDSFVTLTLSGIVRMYDAGKGVHAVFENTSGTSFKLNTLYGQHGRFHSHSAII